jgi:hypothetical protein
MRFTNVEDDMVKPQEMPSEVTAVMGEVIVEGPDAIAYSMTPEAAVQTSARLLQGAARAYSQRRKMSGDGEDRED